MLGMIEQEESDRILFTRPREIVDQRRDVARGRERMLQLAACLVLLVVAQKFFARLEAKFPERL